MLLMGSIATMGYAEHTGRVYVDTNQNGKYDKGEKTLKGVSVSDGLNVVQTQADGTFSLAGHSRERFIFITTPSGYKTDNHYYIRITKTQEKYDFGVQEWQGKITSDGSHRFIHIADTEIFNTSNWEDWTDEVKDYARNENAAFIIHTGDICYDNGLKQHIKLMNTSNMGCPVFYCLGNHDLVKGKYGEEVFENNYGPVYYSFDFGSTHYIVTPMPGGDYQPGYTQEDVMNWLKNDLAQQPEGKPIILFNHDLYTYDDNFTLKLNQQENIKLADYNLKAWIYGHWHINYIMRQGKALTICTSSLDKGGIDHAATAFREVKVDKNGNLKTQLHYTYIDKQIAFASIGNDVCAQNEDGSLLLSVNAYHSVSPVKEITFECFSNTQKKVLGKKTLQRNSDWNWATTFSLPEQYRNQRIFVTANVLFNNGEKAVKHASFVYRPAATDNSLPQLQWVNNLKANLHYTSPVKGDGNIFMASLDEDLRGEGAVFALDEQTGNVKWRYQVRNSIKNRIGFENHTVFAQDAEGYLYAIDAQSGKLKWERKMNVDQLPSLIEGLAVANGKVFAGSGKGFGAYNTSTGEPVWMNTEWNQNQGATSFPLLTEKAVIFGTQWGALYGNDIQTGKLLWTLSQKDIRDRGATPAYADGLLYVASGKSFFIIEPQHGKIILQKELPYNVDCNSTPLVTDKLIVFGTAEEGIVALNRQTLEMEWKVKTNPALIYTAPYTRYPGATVDTTPILIGNNIYFGASDGCLYGVDAETGKTVWKHHTGAPVFSSIQTDDNGFYAADYGGNVYRFHLQATR